MRRLAPHEIALALGIAGCALVALAAIWNLGAAAQAWLAAYLFWVGLPVGALFVTLAHGLIGGRWGLALRPALAGMVRTTPLLALFLIPVLLGARQIYPWARAGGHGWLDLPFFAARAILYIVLWNAIALGAERYRRPDGRLPAGFAWLALIVLFGTTTLAAFDWVMTLEPRWTSTIFGLLVTTGWVLCAVAIAIAITLRRAAAPAPEAQDALARILLAFIVLWAYLSAVQLIVVWESDLASEIPWYLRRMAGGWWIVAVAFVAFEFVVPFLLLLWQPLRRSRSVLLAATLALAAAHLGETWWFIVPDFSRPFGWVEPVAAVAIGGCVLFIVGRGFGPDPLPLRPSRARG